MAMYVVDPYLERRLKAERISSRSDRFDEVWDGVYFMPPLPNNEHQFFQTQLAVVLQLALGSVDQGTAYAGVNVSDPAFRKAVSPLNPSSIPGLSELVRDASTASFHLAMMVGAALLILGAIVNAIGIEDPGRVVQRSLRAGGAQPAKEAT